MTAAVGHNPARRLRHELGLLLEAAAGQDGRNILARDVYVKAFPDVSTEERLSRRVALLARLVDEARAAMRAYRPALVDSTERTFCRVERAALRVPSDSWMKFWLALGEEATLDHLESISELIDDGDHRKLRIETADDLAAHLQSLLDDLADDPPGGLSAEQRDDLRRRLAEMIVLLREPGGTTGGLANVAEGLTGLVLRDHEFVGKLWTSKAGRQIAIALATVISVLGVGSFAAVLGLGDETPPPDPVIQNCMIIDRPTLPALESGNGAPPTEPRALPSGGSNGSG